MIEAGVPLVVLPEEGESGTGYLLRSAASNGASLTAIRKLVGTCETAHFKQSHAQLLASLLRVDAAWLSFRLPAISGNGSGARVQIYGHQFQAMSSTRLSAPQVCPTCLRENPYVRANWEFAISTVCRVHRCALVDCCPVCQKILRWDRANVDWGRCKHYLGGQQIPADVPIGNAFAQAVLENALLGLGSADLLAEIGLPRWLSDLSIDGWTRLCKAIGAIERPNQVAKPGTFVKVMRAKEAFVVIGRGMQRLIDHFAGRLTERCAADVVCEAPLRKLVLAPAAPRDREIAMRIFTSLLGERAFESLVRSHPLLGQRSLF